MNVFIVGDSAVMLKNLLSILSDISGVVVAGNAADEADAIERIDFLLPDVVILDIGLRHGTGMGVLKSVKGRHPAIKVMVLGECTDEFYSHRCKRAGADHFFDKAFQLTKIHAALRQWIFANGPDEGDGAMLAAGC